MENNAITIAVSLIKQFEGLSLKAYQDQRGVWSIGYGTTIPTLMSFTDHSTYILPGPGVVWDRGTADRALLEAVEMVASGLLAVLSKIQTPLSDNQEAALIDFVYNCGLHNFEHSGVLRSLRLNQPYQAADNLLLWNRVGNYVSPGLTRRREAERQLFLSVPTSSLQ